MVVVSCGDDFLLSDCSVQLVPAQQHIAAVLELERAIPVSAWHPTREFVQKGSPR